MTPSLGRFYFTRATCVTGWMMRLQRGTERARNWHTPQWMAAEIQRGTQNGAQMAYLDAC
jgi:hypothetical protein